MFLLSPDCTVSDIVFLSGQYLWLSFPLVHLSLYVWLAFFSLQTLEVKVPLNETYFARWVGKWCMISGTERRLLSDVLPGAGLHQSAYRKASLVMQLWASRRTYLKVKEKIFSRKRRNQLMSLGSLVTPLEVAKELNALVLVSLVFVS